MKIDLTGKEYRLLLDLLEVSSWILFAHDTHEPKGKKKPYYTLEQKLLSYAKESGFEDLIEYSPEHKRYLPTRKMEEGVAQEFIDEFENNSFWDELIHRLAERELIRQEGAERVQKMPPEVRFEKLDKLEDAYSREFELNGIRNVALKPSMEN